MQIELTVNGSSSLHEIQPGMLLSELLKTNQAVWLEGRRVDATLMLAAQAHGRSVQLKPAENDVALLENLLVPEPSRC